MVILSPAALSRVYWTQESALIWSGTLLAAYTGSFVFLCCQADDHNDKNNPPSKKYIFLARRLSRSAYAVLSLNWSPLFNMRSIRGDNHHKDPRIHFSLTSSRIDSIRTLQSLMFLIVMLIINVNSCAYIWNMWLWWLEIGFTWR
jgi:hypothetical protein